MMSSPRYLNWPFFRPVIARHMLCRPGIDREIRALRIYGGATEVQQLIIARELLKDVW